MTGLEPRSSDVGSFPSANAATTIALPVKSANDETLLELTTMHFKALRPHKAKIVSSNPTNKWKAFLI